MPLRPLPARLGATLLCVTALCVGGGLAHAKHKLSTQKQEPSWEGDIKVDDQAGAKSLATNSTCEGLKKNLMHHIVLMKRTKADMEKEDKKLLAPSLLGVMKQMTGQPYTSTAAQKRQRTLETERRAADEVNGMMKTVGCNPVDIEVELKRKDDDGTPVAAPEAPHVILPDQSVPR